MDVWKTAGVAAAGAALTYSVSSATLDYRLDASKVEAKEPVGAATNRGDSDQTESSVDARFVELSIEAAEARTETKFAQLLGEIRVLGEKVSNLAGDLTNARTEIGEAKAAAASGKTYVIGTGIALGGFIIALFAFGWQILDAASGLFQAGGVK